MCERLVYNLQTHMSGKVTSQAGRLAGIADSLHFKQSMTATPETLLSMQHDIGHISQFLQASQGLQHRCVQRSSPVPIVDFPAVVCHQSSQTFT
jgi:hypothetical protein